MSRDDGDDVACHVELHYRSQVEAENMRFALSPGHQLGKFYIGQSLHSALKQLKEASNGRGSPLWKQVDVLSPKDRLRPVIVVGLLEDGSKWAITFDGVHHIALTASITLDAPVDGSTGRMLELQKEEDSFPRHHRSPRLLQTWVTSRGRPESLNSRCSANGLVVLEACTVEQASTSGTGFVSKVLCEGVLLTLNHDTIPSSNVVVPPPFAPISLQDLLPMDCHIIGIEVLPQSTSPLLPLLHSIRKANKKEVTLARPLQTIPFVYMVLGGSDGRVVGICVSQECPPAAAPFSTHEHHNPHYHGQRKVLFGDTMQSVLTELGAPESCYYRTLDNAEMFLPLPEGLTRLEQHMSCHRTDVFFNYFRLGVDIVFDAVSMGVKKFVLHASPPEAVEFESYSRCNFRLACSQGRLATGNEAQIVFSPSHMWSQVASHLGTACHLQKVVQHRELEFLGHPCTTHSWYSALGQCMVEVLENDVISCICILPDVVDDCTLPPVPSEDVSLPMQSPTGQEYEEEACPSIPSSLPSTVDDFEDARSSFQTPSSSLGFTSSHKMDCPPPLFPNVNVVLCEAQGNADQPMHSNLEGERELLKSAGAIVVVPCFTDAEESEELDDEEQTSSANEKDGEVVSVDRECSSSEWNVQSEAVHGSSSQRGNAEASLTSNFDVISSLRSDTEVTAEEATPPNSSPTIDSESVEGEQIVAEPKVVLYKPGGSAKKASRLQDIIDSSQSSSGRTSETKGNRAIVAGRVGRPAGEVVKKSSGKRSKFSVSEREEKLLQRLCKPTATSLIRQTKASPMAPQSSEEKQQQDELWKVGSDQLLSTSNRMDVTEEEEEAACDAVEGIPASETDLVSVFHTGEVGDYIGANMEEYNEDAVGVAPLDLLAMPFVQQHAQMNQFRSDTFDRLFPTEQPTEDPKPILTAASTAVQEVGENNPPASLATPDLSLGSFQDALLKQFDMIKDCSTCGSDLSTVNNGGHSDLCTENGGSHGNQSTTNEDSRGDQSTTNEDSRGDQSATSDGPVQSAANGKSQNNLSTVNSSGATTQSEEVACNRVASEGAVSSGGSQQEKTSAEPLLPFSDSLEQTHGSTSSVIDPHSTVTLPGCHTPDDVGDSIRDDDAQTNSRSHEDEVALDALHTGRWMDSPICTVSGALYQDKVEPLMSLVSGSCMLGSCLNWWRLLMLSANVLVTPCYPC